MPELPEVETIKNDLKKLIVGRKIVDIITDSAKQVLPSLKIVKKGIVGTRIQKIGRRAKLFQILLSNGKILAVHLKMTGRLLVRKKGDPKDDWQHVTIRIQDTGYKAQRGRELELRFCDLRKFGWIKLMTKKELGIMNREFGKEPLRDLRLEDLKKILLSTRRPIKVLLLDQKKIAGIGNIYACEASFLAKIHPEKRANQLTDKETKNLFKAIERVLKAGIKYRGASDQYYLDALGHKGSYQKHFLVYNRAGKKCLKCDGRVKKMKLGGRGTYFCPSCQK